jgi:hypothetical protein
VTLGLSAQGEESDTQEPQPTEPAITEVTAGGAGGAPPLVPAGSGGSAGQTPPAITPSPSVMPEPTTPAPLATTSPEPLFSEPVLVAELASGTEDDNPTLTEDLLQIYFTSVREGGPGRSDVWFAERASADEPFGAPALVERVSTPEFDSSPAISPDGLTLWVAIDIEGGQGGLDIWAATRASRDDEWLAPLNVSELNSAADDLPRPLGDMGRIMPVQSRRGSSLYQTYLASRVTTSDPFGEPAQLQSLLVEGQAMGDGFVTNDALGVYFAYSSEERGELYFASRLSRADDFNSAVALSTLNQASSDERDPWLSADGTRFYFASDRSGALSIYEARLQAAP